MAQGQAGLMSQSSAAVPALAGSPHVPTAPGLRQGAELLGGACEGSVQPEIMPVSWGNSWGIGQ